MTRVEDEWTFNRTDRATVFRIGEVTWVSDDGAYVSVRFPGSQTMGNVAIADHITDPLEKLVLVLIDRDAAAVVAAMKQPT